jgi:membrane associated rhomboid family serine protease
MFLPFYDRNALKHIDYHYVTTGIVVLTTAIFVVFQSGLVLDLNEAAVLGFGLVPALFAGSVVLPDGIVTVPSEATLVTYAFLHANWLHLGSNMLFVWVFGDNVEDAVGHVRFIAFYLLCAVGGAMAHYLFEPSSTIPLVGASGAGAGIVSAYLMLHPRVRVWCLVLFRIPLPLPAWLVLGMWIGTQVIAVAMPDPETNVAWWAHIGGLVTGAVLILVLKRPGTVLFDRDLPPARPSRRSAGA